MGGWIKFDKDMAEDPRLAEAAQTLSDRYQLGHRTSKMGGSDLSKGDALRFASNALRGALVTLWIYADTHIRNDDTLAISSDTLDALVGLDGFSGMLPADWLVELDDGTIKLPGYCEKNGLISKEKRAADSKARQAAWRARHKKSNAIGNAAHNGSITQIKRVTKCVDLDLDQDLDQDLNLKKETRKEVSRESEPEVIRRIREAYPKGLYRDAEWLSAEHQIAHLLEGGTSAADLLAATISYAFQQVALRNTGTQFILGPAKFFKGEWRGPFPLPSDKPELNAPVLTWRPPPDKPEAST